MSAAAFRHALISVSALSLLGVLVVATGNQWSGESSGVPPASTHPARVQPAYAPVQPSGSARQPSTTGVRDVDWHSVTMPVPPVGPCPANTVDFTAGQGRTGDSIYRFTPQRPITYAEVTGDGVTDALIFLDCGPPASEYSTALVAMTTTPTGEIRALGTVVDTGEWLRQPTAVTVRDGRIHVTITDLRTSKAAHRQLRWQPETGTFVPADRP